MLSIPKIIGIILGSFMLCLSLFDVSQARHNKGTTHVLTAEHLVSRSAEQESGRASAPSREKCFTSMARDFSSSKLTARK